MGKKLKPVARRIVRLTLRKLFDPLLRKKDTWTTPIVMIIYRFLYRRVIPMGLFEPGTVALIKRILKKGMTFLDLGAHTGSYTLLASYLVAETDTVFAFEPDPENFALLEASVKGRKNVSLIQKAVSNQVGTTKLFLSSHDSITHSICDAHDGRQSIDVEVTSLDEFFRGKDCKIDLIKMDIEGAEMSALEGMTNIIKQNKNLKIITEFCPSYFEPLSYSPVSFLNKLVECGFKLYLINDETEDIEFKTVSDIIGLFEGGTGRAFVNLYCEKG